MLDKIELENKTVLVTGAAGFIGSNLVLELLRTIPSIHMIGIDNMNDYYDVSIKEWRLSEIETCAEEHPESTWTFEKGSIADRGLIDKIFQEQNPDIVVNLAAQAGVRYSITNPDVYVEWSINEKAALEVAAGASYAGARTMVTMKQVGMNVASDPLMCLAYMGIKGGMVLVVADDPGPISSQTEQDTRAFASYCKLPVFDPTSPEEAYGMIQEAFEYSEKYETPVLFRPTTRVCHGCASMYVEDRIRIHQPEGFIKDSSKWVIFPRTAYQNHLKIVSRNPEIGEDFSRNHYNQLSGTGKKGIAVGGISYIYAMETLSQEAEMPCRMMKVATPYPFPESLALEFLDGLDEVLCLEELDPVIERELIYLCGKHHLNVEIKGKQTGHTASAGENTVESVKKDIQNFLGKGILKTLDDTNNNVVELPQLPVRPPVLCAGCPHRASFYAVKQAMKGKKAVFSGDIGCYTL